MEVEKKGGIARKDRQPKEEGDTRQDYCSLLPELSQGMTESDCWSSHLFGREERSVPTEPYLSWSASSCVHCRSVPGETGMAGAQVLEPCLHYYYYCY